MGAGNETEGSPSLLSNWPKSLLLLPETVENPKKKSPVCSDVNFRLPTVTGLTGVWVWGEEREGERIKFTIIFASFPLLLLGSTSRLCMKLTFAASRSQFIPIHFFFLLHLTFHSISSICSLQNSPPLCLSLKSHFCPSFSPDSPVFEPTEPIHLAFCCVLPPSFHTTD